MAKPEWGVKRTCQSCGARFYDMQKSPIVCPSCETVFDPEAIFRPRRARAEEPAPKPANDDATKPAASEEDEVAALVDGVEVEDDDDEDDAALAPDLDDDDDDEPVVVVKKDDDES